MAASAQISGILVGRPESDRQAYDEVFALVYDELHRLASGYFRGERTNHTLQPTALIHEVYLRLGNGKTPSYLNRSHFVAIAAGAMRQILVDHARRRSAAKRSSVEPIIALEGQGFGSGAMEEILSLNIAMEELSRQDVRKGRIIELRYFGGLTNEEIAEALDMSVPTVEREIRFGKAWLNKKMKI